MKIFNLSLQRTGTQSFHKLMSTKVNSLHYVDNDFLQYTKTESELWEYYRNTYIESDYIAFSDFPVPIFLDNLFSEFKNSKFIFFTRPKEDWVRSIKIHKDKSIANFMNNSIDDIFYKKYINKSFIELKEDDFCNAYDLYHLDIEKYKDNILMLNLNDSPKFISRRISNYVGIKFDINYPSFDYFKSI